ncbi:AAC(3) family N-acetyltransferase [Kribbella capetownensis]|uniref:Aminoglycoside N(3)-acetyltransferase n=1 Tax=Kribbella capetownensis TaxID=1572659 RepID=A0A4R0IYJ1_9ACTN|nr:AAC(3) family N-acetyltransferase [Kribbella capetownensis]
MVDGCVTRGALVGDLRGLGVRAGGLVLMHSSLRSLGFVVGGPQAVVEALLEVLTPEGTLVVPTHTPDNTDPAHWVSPPVPEAWWSVIREEAPGFDPALTPAGRALGRLAELVRTWPGARRSSHPQVSFAALGARADEVVEGHRLDDGLGESSPLGAVYRLDGSVLLLGCGHERNTSMHLSEWRSPKAPRHVVGSAIKLADGTAVWREWEDVDEDEGDFGQIGEAFEAAGGARVGMVGAATARLMSQRAVVDFATDWMSQHRF